MIDDELTVGHVRAYLPETEGEEALWHVLHEDGDTEDLDEDELLQALELYRVSRLQDPNRLPSGWKGWVPVNDDEEEEEEERRRAPKRRLYDDDDDDLGLVEGVEEGDMCAVCQEEIYPCRDEPHALTKLWPCDHVFHTECLRKCHERWKSHCPLCKQYFSRRGLKKKPRRAG